MLACEWTLLCMLRATSPACAHRLRCMHLYCSTGAAGQQQERAAAQTAIMAHPSDEELRSAVQDICESENAWAPWAGSRWSACAGRWRPVEIVNAGLRGKTVKAATALNLPLAQLSCSTPGAACMCVAQV